MHETENLRAGTNVLFFSTEKKTGKPIMELVGLAAYTANDTVDFGPVVGKVDVSKEIEKRMDAMFGEGKWYVKVPVPERPVDIQMVIVADTSASLCDDLKNMEKLPGVIEKLRKGGRKASATLYLLPGGNTVCDNNGKRDPIDPSNFKETAYFHTLSMNSIDLEWKCSLKVDLYGNTDESWADGLRCAISHGPLGGWKPGTARIAAPLSDELPASSDSCPGKGSNKWKRLQKAVELANENDTNIFSLKANPCSNIVWWQKNGVWQRRGGFTQMQCNCESNLEMYMEEAANKTGGKMYDLKDASQATGAIKDIIKEQKPTGIPKIEAGTQLSAPRSQRKRIYSWEFPIPVSLSGLYTTAYVYTWN